MKPIYERQYIHHRIFQRENLQEFLGSTGILLRRRRISTEYILDVGLCIQKQCVLDTLQQVNQVGRFIWRCAVICRWKYHRSCPNTLWHCDKHHKLIKYGIVIHGFIGGNCCTVCHFVSLAAKHWSLIPNSRSLHFMQTQTILQVQFLNYSYRLWRHVVLHLEFREIVEGKMFSFLHIWLWNMVWTVGHSHREGRWS